MKAKWLLGSSLALGSLVPAAMIAACTGSVGDAGPAANLRPSPPTPPIGSAASGGEGGTGTGAGTSTAAGAPTVTVNTAGPPAAESAGTLLMRRLTYREYDHMMAQLLGDTTSPASGSMPWTPDMAGDSGFVAPTSVASYHVIQYEQTANALVTTALQAAAAGKPTGKFAIPCTNPDAAAETTCATQFITNFGLHAYRRPVSAAEQTDLLALFSAVRTNLSFTDSVGELAKAMLQSPNFLYHWEIGPMNAVAGPDGLAPLTQWQVASRLAETIWESMPDDALLQAAQNGELGSPTQVAAQAERMLQDPQAIQSLYSFHLQWIFNMGFHVTDLATIIAKPNSLLTDAAAQGLQTEFTQFLASVYVPPGDGTLNTLYTAPYAFVNHDLAAIYGVAGPATGFARVALDPTQRGGIFTQVAFLAGIEDSIADNPVYRGLAIYTKALCGLIGPPPSNNIPGVNFVPGATTRQAYDKHGSSGCALRCHGVFDPAGFAFENYDGVGKYRTNESGIPVDATGTFPTPLMAQGLGGSTFTFSGALDLSKQLAANAEAQACVDRQWTRYMLGRMETPAEEGSLEVAYRTGAATAGFSVRDMLVALVSSKAFLYRLPSPGEM
jgi:uncharacterized protein DUF1592/uncharacterized protein DUF1588/uncharacterized protein DUF1595/uncharacterized protein DUF1585